MAEINSFKESFRNLPRERKAVVLKFIVEMMLVSKGELVLSESDRSVLSSSHHLFSSEERRACVGCFEILLEKSIHSNDTL